MNLDAKGVFPIRKLQPIQISAVEEIYKLVAPKNEMQEMTWCKVYINQCFCIEKTVEVLKFHSLVSSLATECSGIPSQEIYISNYGFYVSPPFCKTNQPFHIDYHKHVHTLFIPMVPLTPRNATQFFEFELKSSPMKSSRGWTSYGYSIQEIMKKEGIQIQVSENNKFTKQLFGHQWQLLAMHAGTVHRGIGNGEKSERIMFYANYSKQKFQVPNQKC